MDDTIFMQADWEDSNGAKMEREAALAMGLNCIYE
jgi:hypothetical protein